MRTITGHDELKAAEGETLGTSEWREVTQADVDAFADVTGDHQFIHVDVEKAKQTPFGGTIVHGYFTLALVPVITEAVVAFEGFNFALNYGVNKVRFPSPVPTGSKLRGTVAVKEVQTGDSGSQAVLTVTIERDNGDKPVCVAESVVRFA